MRNKRLSRKIRIILEIKKAPRRRKNPLRATPRRKAK
jgi:hypothetical protein